MASEAIFTVGLNMNAGKSKVIVRSSVKKKLSCIITYLRTGLLTELPIQSCHGFNGRTSSRERDYDYHYLWN